MSASTTPSLCYSCPTSQNETWKGMTSAAVLRYTIYNNGNDVTCGTGAGPLTCHYQEGNSATESAYLAIYSAKLSQAGSLLWIWGGWACGNGLPTVGSFVCPGGIQKKIEGDSITFSELVSEVRCNQGFSVGSLVCNAAINAGVTELEVVSAQVSAVSSCVGSLLLPDCSYANLV